MRQWGKKRRAQVAALAVISCVAVGLTGCSSSDSGATSSAGSSAGSGSTTAGPLLVAADNGSPNFERNFNPYSGTKRTMATVIYEPLFVLNSMKGELVPFLGVSYEQPDAKTIVVTLRDSATWSDDEAFSADDVTFTYDLLKKFPALDTTGVWQYIDTVSAAGNKVTITLKEADVPAANIVLTVPIVPKHIWEDVSDPTTYKDENPVGTGPYVLDKFTATQYTMKKNETYYQADKVAAPELTLPASNTQLEVVNNNYDWAYAYISDVENTWVRAHEGNTYWFPPGGTVAIMPNLTKAPFDNADFRRGLSAALDREKIADTAEEGYVDAAGQTGLLLPNQDEWLDSSIPDKGAITQDLDKAKECFEKAGYTYDGDKLVDSSGQQVSMSLTTPNGWTDWLRGAQEVQKELTAAGIDVKLNQPQPAAYYQAQQNGDFDLLLSSFGGTGSIYTDFNNLLSSSFYQPIGTATQANFERYKDSDVDATLDKLKSATDVDEQKQLGYALQQKMYDDVPVIGLFYGGLWGLFSERQYTGWPSADNPYASPATWGSNPLLILTNITAK
ncbi:MAG: ABC transporter substrate-binding protein [Ancrocorticia sp.]|nr:ABC transporter substrate-binding protein [Ancrocorticia sp.]MCI2001746.1 ABC transporter substrate-binding protein [Ancrocorticia sp.]MCI2178576.1 ABC transporter substrate-binding protein [Ancrocorticia sp.]MCI2194183.1 ABC transporter substrate-binding protein [Ancrocorticia sp.]MCI2199042.1 ABC transporter substrate-binding protein [Ancrocorticia sp.]